eukprot:7295747-Pyramimonas_sp.AAC.1
MCSQVALWRGRPDTLLRNRTFARDLVAMCTDPAPSTFRTHALALASVAMYLGVAPWLELSLLVVRHS